MSPSRSRVGSGSAGPCERRISAAADAPLPYAEYNIALRGASRPYQDGEVDRGRRADEVTLVAADREPFLPLPGLEPLLPLAGLEPLRLLVDFVPLMASPIDSASTIV